MRRTNRNEEKIIFVFDNCNDIVTHDRKRL